MPMLALAALDAHPNNANRMPSRLFAKLIGHLRHSGRCPPLIVRPFPTRDSGRFQILDGHHRAEALRRLGHEQANCEIWDADDAQADMLLLTLNRLHGEDDPLRRGALLETMLERSSVAELSRWLPDDAARIRRLVDLQAAPPPPAPAPALPDMPHAITFFLTARQRDTLIARLDSVSRDRSRALVELMSLDGPAGRIGGAL